MTERKPKAVRLALESSGYQRLLKCGEDTSAVHSGMVCLEPGKSIGNHSTNDGEEVIIVLNGEGEISFDDYETLKMAEGFLIYCPSYTEHDVKNSGNELLKYVFFVAKVS